MFFIIAKIFWGLCAPFTFLLVLIGVGLLAQPRKWALRLTQSAFIFLLSIGVFPVGHNILVALEGVYSDQTLPPEVDGIIMLGGVIDIKTSVARNQVQLSERANRLVDMARLSRLYPHASCVVSGGNGTVQGISTTESAQAQILLKQLNIDTDRFVFEDKSRDTYENMLYSKELVHPQPGDKWLLITSSFHMPRAVAVFSSNGWPVQPVPSGYLTDGVYRYAPTLDLLGSYYKFQVAVREIVGIIAYTLTERIKTDDTHEDHDNLHAASTESAEPATPISGVSR